MVRKNYPSGTIFYFDIQQDNRGSNYYKQNSADLEEVDKNMNDNYFLKLS